jgi:hypothetical protein
MRKTIITCVVAIMALGGGSAVAAKFITSADIKDGTIQSKDLSKVLNTERKSSTTRIAKLERTVRSLGGTVPTGGATGPAGAKGDAGASGPTGVSGYEVNTYDYIAAMGHRPGKDGADPGYGGIGNGAIATVKCSPGKIAVGGGYFFRNGGNDTANGITPPDGAFTSSATTDGTAVTASFPGRMDWATMTVKPGDNSGWIIQVNNGGGLNAHDLTMYVICVNAS